MDTDYLATGYYECKTDDDDDESAKVYVYVGDINNLLAVKPEDTMLLRVQYQDVVVPCKPTAPEITVTLQKEDEIVCKHTYCMLLFPP